MATTTLNLYKYTGPLNTINKTLPTATKKTGTQVEPPQSVLECDFIITGTAIPEYNYAYVSTFKRYYFITDCLWLGGNAFQIHLKCDVLFTNKTKIQALNAMVKFSQYGDALERDDRLNYKDYTTADVTSNVPYYNEYNTVSSGTDPMIMIRYYNMPPRLSGSGTPPQKLTAIWAVIMSQTKYSDFMATYASNLLTEEKRTAVANAIIDVSEVYYMTPARCAASNLTASSNSLTIATPDFPEGIEISTADWGFNGPFYICDNPAAQLPSLGYYECPAFEVQLARYEYVNGKYESQLPFLGTKEIVPADIGIYYPCTVSYQITFDMIGNNYVVTPVVTRTSTGVTTVLYNYSDVIENHKKTGFLSNESLNRNTWAVVGLLASGVSAAATGNLGGVITAGKNVIDTRKSVAAATHYIGGFSSEYEYATTARPPFMNISHIIEVDTNPTVFNPLWGYPDHQIRTLSSIAAATWFQCEAVDMRSFSTITKTEVDEIENLLLSGVYA